MGCWNELCPISRLPINEGDEVYAQVIISYYGWCPLGFPILGEYNDYGSLKNETQILHTLEQIKGLHRTVYKDNLVEHHEITEFSRGTDELLHELQVGDLTVKDLNGEHSPLKIIYIRKDVFEVVTTPQDRDDLHLLARDYLKNFLSLGERYLKLGFHSEFETTYVFKGEWKHESLYEQIKDFLIIGSSIYSDYVKRAMFNLYHNPDPVIEVQIAEGLANLFLLTRAFFGTNTRIAPNHMRGAQFRVSEEQKRLFEFCFKFQEFKGES
jgi:hypothetical protein